MDRVAATVLYFFAILLAGVAIKIAWPGLSSFADFMGGWLSAVVVCRRHIWTEAS